jgi:hypothetical protein
MKKLFYSLTLLILVIMNLQAQSCFTLNWSGNGYDHMNFYIKSAILGSTNLQVGDEIGIFDGEVCVGKGTLTQVLIGSNFLSVITSHDDPGTLQKDGFTVGNTVSFRYCINNGT